jgi:hypothetical protein
MITVALDAEAIAKQYGKRAEDILQRAVDALGEFALDRVRQKSSEQLDIETWQKFSRSIQTTRDKLSVTLSIEDPRMVSIETGYSSFDIKPGLLNGPNVKQGENGPYQDVPFVHRTTKRGGGSYVESKSMRAAIDKAVSKAKSTGETVRLGKISAAAAKIAGLKVTAQKGAQTFRRVSKNSKPDSWIHPGLKGIAVFESTAQDIEAIKERVIQDVAKAAT